jgi:hypothetical protein
VETAHLIEKYKIDEGAIEKIENEFYRKTGKRVTLDKAERGALGME